MAARSLRHVHPGAALAIALVVAGALAWALVARGAPSLWPARAESWFESKAGRAFYLDEPVQR